MHDVRDVDWDPPFEPPEGISVEELNMLRNQWEDMRRRLRIAKDVLFRHPEDIHVSANKSRRQHDDNSIRRVLVGATFEDLDAVLEFMLTHHAEDELFLVFRYALSLDTLPESEFISKWMEANPALVFALLRCRPPTDDLDLNPDIVGMGVTLNLVRAIVQSANDTGIAALVAIEKIARSLPLIRLSDYIDMLMRVALTVRWKGLVQEVLLVLNENRLNQLPQPLSPEDVYAHKHALNVAFDRAEEADDECPTNEDGNPRRQKGFTPLQIALRFANGPTDRYHLKAAIRLDTKHSIRLHSHVRLKAISKPENRFVKTLVLDGLVTLAFRGDYGIELMQPAPPELEQMDWVVYNAGSIRKCLFTSFASMILIASSFRSYCTGDA